MSENFRIFETSQFAKNFKNLQPNTRRKIYAKILNYIYPQLKENPFYGKNIKKLKDYLPQTWRYRTGNFRIFYEIDKEKKIIFMTAFENRKNAY